MVLVTQSNVNEDSQSRQLRVSKKLSKAISSVPRSRFQKPRPNLPGSKRIDSSVPSVRKTNETPRNTDTTNTENSNINESSQKSDTLENATTVNAENHCRDKYTSDEIVIKPENLSTDETSENNDIQKIAEKSMTDEKSYEIFEKNESAKLFDDDIIIEKSQNVEELKKSLNTDEPTQNDPAEISENLNALTDEISLSDDTVTSLSTNNESIQELSVEKTSTLEVPDSTDILPFTTPNNNDKSFKYPHLTSILSKKRAEPKKEVQHKKRKKFKKGDAAPERSKMTMADLIYWNPTNTEPPSKSAVTEYEISTNSNVDDPEETPDADIPVEENNVCDSVPKLVISEDGSINIDQSSLVVSRNIAEPTITEVIRKDDTTYSSFRKRPMTKHWTAKDTTIFYKALSLVGTDFGLMETIFPHRTRRELKLKFKREEKFNIDLINRAMYESQLTFDANTLGDLIKNLNDLTGDFSTENGQDDSQPSSKEKKKYRKRKIPKSAKFVDPDVGDAVPEIISEDVTTTNSDKVKSKRRRKAKKLPEDFVDTDEIDDIVLLEEEESGETNNNDAACELNSTEIASEENLSKMKDCKSQSESSIPSSSSACDTTNIEILCIEDIGNVDLDTSLKGSESILVPENNSDLSEVITIQDSNCENASQTISFAGDNEQEQCITLEYVDVNESGDITVLNNVMAFEVVACNTPIPKRRRKVNFTPKLPKKDLLKKSCQPIKLSSTNYTPA